MTGDKMKKKKRKNSKQFNKQFKRKFFSVKTVPLVVFTMLIVVFASVGYIHLVRQAKVYERQINELSTEVSELKKKNQALEEKKENMDSEAFKEQMAREKLGMVGKDEYVLEKSDDAKETGTTDKKADTKESSEDKDDRTADSTKEEENSKKRD